MNFRFLDSAISLRTIMAVMLAVSSAFFDWLPTRGSRETNVDSADATHGQGDTVLLLLSVDRVAVIVAVHMAQEENDESFNTPEAT